MATTGPKRTGTRSTGTKKTTKTTKSTKAKPRRTPAARKPPVLKSLNPQTGEVRAEIASTDPAEVKEVVELARKVAPEWAAIPPEGRVRLLREVRFRMYDLMDELVETVAAECGKPRAEALAHDVVPPMMMLAYLERTTAKALRPQKVGRLIAPLLGASSRIEWRPFGVVGCITPWNYPIQNSFLAFATPLFAGNAVVIKPSEVTPACGELLKKILDPLPPGVATVIQGGGEVGAALVDARCDKISFVGSPRTGRRICEAAAPHLTPVVMELGGKDAAIVTSDADLEAASSGVLWGSFFNSGQTCCSIERIYVTDDVADDFVDRFTSKLGQLRQGSENNDIGSLTFAPQLKIVEDQVADAVKHGAQVIAGGAGAGIKNAKGTLWYAPTVLEKVNDEMKVLHEETFGPVVTITRVRDEEEAIRRANEESVNLTASVWSSNKQRSEAIMKRLKAGGIGANMHGVLPGLPWAPWGGVGESGYGRLNGELGLKEFSVPVHVANNLTPQMKNIFWFPYDKPTEEVVRGLGAVLGARDMSTKLSGAVQVAKSIGTALRNKI